MPELLPQPPPLVTTQAPTPGVSAEQIKAPYEEFSNTLQKASDTLSDVAVTAAKSAAAQDLLNQRVTSNADGTVNVENPSTAPLIFGAAGEAYEHAMAAGTVAHVGNVVSESIDQLHRKFPTDPGGFQEASDQYLHNLNLGLPPEMHEAILQDGRQLQRQHFNAITNTAATIDVDNQKNSIQAQIGDLKDTAAGLARGGGTSGPEFQQTVAKLDTAYDALGSNPLFRTPADQIAIEKKNTHAYLQGEAVVGAVDDAFNKRGKAAARQALEDSILNNPNMRESDRARLYSQGMSRLQFLSGDAKATIDANRAIVGDMEKALADRKLSADDPAVGMAIQRAQQVGDTEGAQRLTAAAAIQRHFRGVDVLPDDQKAHVLGRGGYEPVNQSIPPEGRALLKQIGGTESGNRYDVRYTPNGGEAFSTFADHPDIAEPIATGPDAGNTSNAAGYYQFLNSTWQAQKAKLGLKDFSPANQDAAAWDLAQTTYKEKTGKDLLTTLRSGNRDDVLPALSGQWSSLPGGRQPATRYLAPSLSGGPGFTADDVKQNPFLLSAYVRSLASDPELRVQSARQTATAIGKTIDNGFPPSPAAVAEVTQAARLYPEKMGAVADEMNGRIAGQLLAQMPDDQRVQAIEAYRAATAGPDVHQINLASAALAQVDRQQQNMREHPLIEASARGWTPPPAPIDPTQPQTIAPALAQRAALSTRIGALNNMPAPPLVDKDDVPKLQTALQGQGGAQVLGSIAQTLKPDDMQMLLREEPFRVAVTGMSRSGDPVKMNAAYSFMDTQQKQNPLQFDKQFPDGLKDLRAWQSNLAFYPPDVAARRLMQSYDPAASAGREAAEKVADKALESVSPANVVAKFSTGWGPFGTGARTPISDQAGIAAGALKADYDKNYRDGFTATGDAAAADKFAVEKLNLKYAVSPTNGNRVMANAPERYYPEVGGSHDWMAPQLDEAVANVVGKQPAPDLLYGTAAELRARQEQRRAQIESVPNRQYQAPRALVPDDQTERDISSGKPPSYQVILQDPNGRWTTMGAGGATQRIRFDPTEAFAKRAGALETVKPAVAELRGAPAFGGVAP